MFFFFRITDLQTMAQQFEAKRQVIFVKIGSDRGTMKQLCVIPVPEQYKHIQNNSFLFQSYILHNNRILT